MRCENLHFPWGEEVQGKGGLVCSRSVRGRNENAPLPLHQQCGSFRRDAWD